jgi:hypothetical protein
MVGPSPSEEVVKTITDLLQAACNSRDVIGVLGHYTPQRAARIRRAVETAFICFDMEMDVEEAFLLSATDTEIVFGVRSGWHERAAPGQVFASRVTAKKVGDSWLLDAEEVLSRKQTSTPSANSPGAVAGRGVGYPVRTASVGFHRISAGSPGDARVGNVGSRTATCDHFARADELFAHCR